VKYKNYYEVLGVAKDTPEKDIKSAYRRLARQWHPDANPDKPQEAEEHFKEIQEAYEVLGDPEKRRKYDALGGAGSDWQRAASQAEQQQRYREAASGFSDFFDAFFSGMGKRGQEPQASRAQDLETTLELTLTEAHEGGRKAVSLQIEDLCARCRGSGLERGRICPTCHGTGRLLTTKRFDITIPRGVREGQRIRLHGQGTATSQGRHGDLYLVVHLVGDDRFTRRGDDIYVDVQVSIYDLVLGAEVKVPTMGGEVTMMIPPGSQNHRTLRLPGKGMPHVRGDGTGDQYVRLIGMLPTNLTDREYKLYRELASLRH